MPNQKLLHLIWTPQDAHEVFERAATLQLIRAVTDEEREPRS